MPSPDNPRQSSQVHSQRRFQCQITFSVFVVKLQWLWLLQVILHSFDRASANFSLKCATGHLDYIGLFHLFKLFLRYCYEPDDPSADLFGHTFVPRPNDFSDFSEYFIRKVLFSVFLINISNSISTLTGPCQRYIPSPTRFWENSAPNSTILH